MPKFENLQDEIDAASSGDTIKLTRDYESTGTGISINKPLTIDGDGHTLNAKGLSSIFLIESSDCTIKNINLTNAIGNGSGAVWVIEDNFHIVNAVISNCSAHMGAAIMSYGKDGVFENLTIENATSIGQGAVYLSDSGNSISNSQFINCYADAASSIYTNGQATLIDNCVFINSHSSGDGGAVFIDADDCQLLNSRFEGNIADDDGGAIYWQGNGGVINNITCINNKAESKGEAVSKGGVICLTGSDVNITNSYFSFNEIESNILNGGALFITGNDVGIINSQFIGFKATNGGSIYVIGNNTNIIMSTFSNSSADYGGSIYWAGNNGNVMMSSFYNSTATSDGGAIYWQGSSGSIQGSIFENCSAVDGGAIYGVNTTILDSHFTNNVASGNGGAIYNCSYDDACEFESNTNPVIYPFKQNVTISLEAADVLVGENIIVNVVLSENITASITIIFDEGVYDVTAIGGYGSLSIPTTKSGSFNIKAIFEENDDYLPANETITVTVSKHDLTVLCEYDEANKSISITLPQDIVNEVDFTIGSINKPLTESEVIDISNFNPGNYTYTIHYAGDDKYKVYDASDSITVPKFNPNIEVIPFNIQYGEGKNITIGIESDVEGNVTFTLINGKNDETIETIILAPDKMYELPSLDTGIYKLQVTYIGDAKYSHELKEVSFKVSPILNISPEVMVGENGLITMELGNVNGSIKVSVDGEEYGSSRISAGKFTYYLPTDDLTAGNHAITFEYSGSSFDKNVFNYWDNETGTYKPIEYLLKVNHKQTTTVSNSDNDNILEVKIDDNEGKVLSNATGEVVFTILNQLTKQYTEVVVSVVNGIAKLDISKFKDGNYLINWNYLGDSQHAPISKELSLKVTHKASRIAAGDLSILYTASKTYSVTVYSSGGQALSGMSVSFLINNKVVKTTTTNSKGVASIVISQVPGSYKITAKSGSASITKKLTVTHLVSLKSVKVKKSAKKLVLQATLKKVNGKYLKNKKVTFKFNGKKLTAKTNKKGVAKVTFKSKVLKKLKAGKKVTYQATYLKDTVKKTVKVKK